MAQPTCQQRIRAQYRSTMSDLRKLWKLYCKDSDASDEDLGSLYDYGLSFDYVAPETFNDQDEGYFRYQLSWGGPSDEFRIYADSTGHGWSIYRMEYWFLDWFDGAHIEVSGKDREFLMELLDSFFVECGSFDSEYDKAVNA